VGAAGTANGGTRQRADARSDKRTFTCPARVASDKSTGSCSESAADERTFRHILCKTCRHRNQKDEEKTEDCFFEFHGRSPFYARQASFVLIK